ncbi:MAG: hypothetical protein PHT03_06945 [Bacilli bacterium]|nr:hypothetical protein [Bacilli bacterium]
MKKWLLNKKSLITVLALTIIISFTAILLPITVNAYGLAGKQTDLIATSNIDDWFQVVADEGDWTPTNDKVTVDAFGGAYALEGATYLTAQGQAL